MNDQTTPTDTTAPERTSPAKLIKAGAAILVLIVAIAFGVYFWRESHAFVSTDNAYLNADRIELVRIEIAPSEMDRVLRKELIDELAKRFRELGFKYVTLDLEGFRSGSMNEVLK